MTGLAVRYQGRSIRFDAVLSSRRRSIAIKVRRDGVVEVRAPTFISPARLKDFVLHRAKWISERQNYFKALVLRHPQKELRSGETFPVLGRGLRLRVTRHRGLGTPFCRLGDRRFEVVVGCRGGEELKSAAWQAIRDWYGSLTERKVNAVVRRHAPSLAVRPEGLHVVDQAQRWASCSKSGGIRCNWRLSMMPMPVLEYIVVHELCHMRTHDHSPKFWRTVKSVLPDYEKRREWLRNIGPALAVAVPRSGEREMRVLSSDGGGSKP